jgi:hypothetical protein
MVKHGHPTYRSGRIKEYATCTHFSSALVALSDLTNPSTISIYTTPLLSLPPYHSLSILFLCFKNFLRFKNKSPKLKKITFPNWMQSKSFNFILAKANQFQWRTIGEALLATRCCQRNNKASSKTHCSLSANQKASIWWKLIRTVY